MPPRRRAPVANETTAALPIFAPDPHGWAMFHSLAAVLHRGVSGQEGRIVMDPNPGFHGYGQTEQNFHGAANLGRGRATTPTSPTLDQERSVPVTDPVLQIFAERTARGR